MQFYKMIDLTADTVSLTTNEFLPVPTDTNTLSINIIHFPAIKISEGLHSLINLLEMILAAPSGVKVWIKLLVIQFY